MTEMYQFNVIYYDNTGNIMKKELQEVPIDGEYHWSKIVEEYRKGKK